MILKIDRLILAVISLAVCGCSLGRDSANSSSSSTETSQYAAEQIGESLSDPESGVSAELNSIASMYAGSSGASLKTIVNQQDVTIQLVFTNATSDNNRFHWDPSSGGYVRNISGNTAVSVNNGWITGNISDYQAHILFFGSTDSSGTGIQLNWPYTLTNNANVHSTVYSRTYNAVITNSLLNLYDKLSIQSVYTDTGINDDTNGFIVNGARTEFVTVSAGVRTGNWTNFWVFNGLTAIRTNENGTNETLFGGTATVNFNGAWSGPRGSKAVNKTVQVQFSGKRTVTVDVDGETAEVDIVTGRQN